MPLRPNLVERFLLRTGIVSGAMLDVETGLYQSTALLTAGELRIFNHLKESTLTLEELTRKTQSSHNGMLLLLTCLVQCEYLELRGDRYTLTRAMLRSFPIDLFPEMVPFFKAAQARIVNATDAVRTDPPGGIIRWDLVRSGDLGKSFQTFMRWIGSSLVAEVVAKVSYSDSPKRMLDIGGSHGLYCVGFCRKYPELRATNLDWEIGLESARITLARETDVADRIDLHEADFEKDDLPRGYDFVFLGNILHGCTDEVNEQLITRIGEATTDNATIAILDQFSPVRGSPFVKGMASLIGWNLFLFGGGVTYEFDKVSRWLQGGGFTSAKRVHLQRSPGFTLITARKSAVRKQF